MFSKIHNDPHIKGWRTQTSARIEILNTQTFSMSKGVCSNKYILRFSRVCFSLSEPQTREWYCGEKANPHTIPKKRNESKKLCQFRLIYLYSVFLPRQTGLVVNREQLWWVNMYPSGVSNPARYLKHRRTGVTLSLKVWRQFQARLPLLH